MRQAHVQLRCELLALHRQPTSSMSMSQPGTWAQFTGGSENFPKQSTRGTTPGVELEGMMSEKPAPRPRRERRVAASIEILRQSISGRRMAGPATNSRLRLPTIARPGLVLVPFPSKQGQLIPFSRWVTCVDRQRRPASMAIQKARGNSCPECSRSTATARPPSATVAAGPQA